MPAGATNSVRLSEDPAGGGAGGSRGMGVFIYRDAIGHGANNFKGVKLRWLHPPSPAAAGSGVTSGAKFDPTKAAVKVHTIAMVYVPEGPCKVGTGRPTGISRFSDGPDMPHVRHDWDSAMQLPDGSFTKEDWGSLTDGSWRGGPSIPFLIDAEWNGPVQEGTRSRRIGTIPGQLWATHTFAEQFFDWQAKLSSGTALNDDYPTGYDAVYCMKYDMTQGQYTEFLNSLPPDVAAGRAFCAKPETKAIEFKGGTLRVYEPEVGAGAWKPEGRHMNEIKVDRGSGYNSYTFIEFGGLTITSSADEPIKIPTGSGSDGGEYKHAGPSTDRKSTRLNSSHTT
jgi:hypothetical protein